MCVGIFTYIYIYTFVHVGRVVGREGGRKAGRVEGGDEFRVGMVEGIHKRRGFALLPPDTRTPARQLVNAAFRRRLQDSAHSWADLCDALLCQQWRGACVQHIPRSKGRSKSYSTSWTGSTRSRLRTPICSLFGPCPASKGCLLPARPLPSVVLA